MKVIGVTGLPGSGKSLFFDMAKEKGVVVVSMGDIIREKAAERQKLSAAYFIGSF